MNAQENLASPILVTGAAGRGGAVGRTVTELLLKQGKTVRAMVRSEDKRAQALRGLGAEVVVGNLLDLTLTGQRPLSVQEFAKQCGGIYRGGKSKRGLSVCGRRSSSIAATLRPARHLLPRVRARAPKK